jgi:hypothetical protein
MQVTFGKDPPQPTPTGCGLEEQGFVAHSFEAPPLPLGLRIPETTMQDGKDQELQPDLIRDGRVTARLRSRTSMDYVIRACNWLHRSPPVDPLCFGHA